MECESKASSVYDIILVITMDATLKLLEDGVLTLEEFNRFFDEMCRKYGSDDVRILYQSMKALQKKKSNMQLTRLSNKLELPLQKRCIVQLKILSKK